MGRPKVLVVQLIRLLITMGCWLPYQDLAPRSILMGHLLYFMKKLRLVICLVHTIIQVFCCARKCATFEKAASNKLVARATCERKADGFSDFVVLFQSIRGQNKGQH